MVNASSSLPDYLLKCLFRKWDKFNHHIGYLLNNLDSVYPEDKDNLLRQLMVDPVLHAMKPQIK